MLVLSREEASCQLHRVGAATFFSILFCQRPPLRMCGAGSAARTAGEAGVKASGLFRSLQVSEENCMCPHVLYHPLSKECDIFCSLSETGRSCISGMVKLGRLILVDTCQETMGWQLAQVEWFSSQLRRRT